MPKRRPPIDKERLTQLYLDGLSDVEIAADLGVATSTVYNIRRDLKLTSKYYVNDGLPKSGGVNVPVGGCVKPEGIDHEAMTVLDNPALLDAVLERACLVCPGLVREKLEKVDGRLSTLLNDGFVAYVARTGQAKAGLKARRRPDKL